MLALSLRCLEAGAAAAVVLQVSKLCRATRARLLLSTVMQPSCEQHVQKTSTRCVHSPDLCALLISNSKLAGLGYLDHVETHVKEFLGNMSGFVLFVPYALADRDGYTAKARARFAQMGYDLRSLHEYGTPEARLSAVHEASCLFVGGGNTYRLLKCLQEDPALLPLVHQRVATGKVRCYLHQHR